jgi:hypothetical protein
MSNKKPSIGSFQELDQLFGAGRAVRQKSVSAATSKPSPYRQGLGAYDRRQGTLSLTVEQKDRKDRSLREREAMLKKWEQELEQREYKHKFEAGRLRKAKEILAGRRELFIRELEELRQLRQNAELYESKLEELGSRAAELDRREARLGVTAVEIKKHKDQIERFRNDAKIARAELGSSKKELTSAKRSIAALTKARDKLADQQRRSGWFEGSIDWVLDNGRRNAGPFSQGVVIVGSDPIDEADLINFFIDRGIDVYETEAEGVECMIVGRDNWTEEQLEMQVAAQQGKTLKVYSQEMALMCLLSGSDVFELEDEEFLAQQAGDHPALSFLKGGELQWPLTIVPAMPKVFQPFEEDGYGVDESPLKKLGYTVGRTHGLPANERRVILKNAYLGPLKRVHSDEYMQDWGQPRTRRRLWRIANHLAWLARSKRNIPNFETAIDHWASDLRALEKDYFKPWMRFAWPEVKVPGTRRRR